MDEPHLYNVELRGEDAKTGLLGSSDDLPTLPVGSPPQFGGPSGMWSPEHLLVASVASCLMTTFRAIAEMSGVEVLDYSDSATGKLVRGEDRLYQITEITLRPRVVISDSAKVDRTFRLLSRAEEVCLISRSISAAVHVEPQVVSQVSVTALV
jgi:organic hydroperoxide reductase OsmC/OhrA